VSEVRIAAEPRTEFGKGGARRTRRAGKVPAVLYGHGEAPRHISLPQRDFEHALRTDAGFNVVLHLDLDNGTEMALPKSIQRNPLRGDIEHADLIIIKRGERVTVAVPVQVNGETPAGGLLELQSDTIEITAEAMHIPQHFEVDLTGLEVGGSVTAGDIKLPSGVELVADPESVVVHIGVAPTAEQVEAELEQAEAELGAGAAGQAEQAAAQEEAEGEQAGELPTGEGEVAPEVSETPDEG
jgi:large subunit ribosomal protein L25